MEDPRQPSRLGNVLVGVDFSVSDAVDRAVFLPITPGSSITLLHVVPAHLPAATERSLRDAAERRLGELAGTITSALRVAGQSGVDVFPKVESGKTVDVICEQAEWARAQVIVMGRAGAGRSTARPIGAKAERVARASHAAVLVVSRAPQGAYRKPLVAIDGSEMSAAVVELALRVTGHEVRPIELVHAFEVAGLGMLRDVQTSDEEIEAYLKESEGRARRQIEQLLPTLPQLGVAYHPVVLQGDPRHVVLDEAVRRKADLIVVGTRGHSRLLRLLMGSVAEAILREATTDVLVVR
jgi:nucleotide-binding universal stress UspA family protein